MGRYSWTVRSSTSSLKQRERLLEEYQKYLDEPIPEDTDIKDED